MRAVDDGNDAMGRGWAPVMYHSIMCAFCIIFYSQQKRQSLHFRSKFEEFRVAAERFDAEENSKRTTIRINSITHVAPGADKGGTY